MYNPSEGRDRGERLLIPSLFVSQLSTRPIGILTSFILVDIAQTFGTTVGVMGQIITAASLAGTIVAPFLAALSMRHRPRTLLLAGIVLITVSSMGCSFAFNYASMLLFYSLSGLGAAMVTPMIMTIVGERIPEEKRSGTIGLIIASTPMLSTLMGLTINRIIGRGWKTAYLQVVFPITFVSLVLAVLGLPKPTDGDVGEQPETSIREGFRQILGHRSAVACLLGTIFCQMAWGGVMWYMISFYRQAFGLPTESAGVIWSANTSVFVIGSLLVGRVVPKVGRKRTTGLMSLLIGVFIILFTNLPGYHASVASVLLVTAFSAVWSSSSNELSLVQVPEYRGAMMSLNSGSSGLGSALGTAVGGLCLTLGGYSLFGWALGIMGFLGFLTISLFARDPTIAVSSELEVDGG